VGAAGNNVSRVHCYCLQPDAIWGYENRYASLPSLRNSCSGAVGTGGGDDVESVEPTRSKNDSVSVENLPGRVRCVYVCASCPSSQTFRHVRRRIDLSCERGRGRWRGPRESTATTAKTARATKLWTLEKRRTFGERCCDVRSTSSTNGLSSLRSRARAANRVNRGRPSLPVERAGGGDRGRESRQPTVNAVPVVAVVGRVDWRHLALSFPTGGNTTRHTATARDLRGHGERRMAAPETGRRRWRERVARMRLVDDRVAPARQKRKYLRTLDALRCY